MPLLKTTITQILFFAALSISNNAFTSEIKWGLSDRIGKRPSMEDTYTVVNPLYPHSAESFFGLFDGHGGFSVAQQVKTNLAPNLAQLISSNTIHPRNDYYLIRSAFEQTDNQLRGKNNRGIEQYINTGCTAVTAWVFNDCTVHVAWLGDSRAVLVNKNGDVDWASQDHKPNDPWEKEAIEGQNGFVENINGIARVGKKGQVASLAVSRAFGDFNYKNGKYNNQISIEPSIVTLGLTSNHLLILACDGVWDVVSNEKAAEIVHSVVSKKNTSVKMNHLNETFETAGNSELLKLAAQELRDYAFKNGSSDNISVMVIQLPGPKAEILETPISFFKQLKNAFNSFNLTTKCAIVGIPALLACACTYAYLKKKN